MLLINMSDVFEEFARSIIQAEFRAGGSFVALDGNIGGALGGLNAFSHQSPMPMTRTAGDARRSDM